MNIKCPSCRHRYTLDHPELREKEICPNCNNVVFVKLSRKPFKQKTASKKIPIICGVACLTILILSIVSLTFQKFSYAEKMNDIKAEHKKHTDALTQQFQEEEKKNLEVVTQLKYKNAELINRINEPNVITVVKEIEEINPLAVKFFDENLKFIIEDTLQIKNPTPEDMLKLKTLNASRSEIGSLIGLEHALNLEELNLEKNKIQDISYIGKLNGLTKLNLSYNEIQDIYSICNMTDLRDLSIGYNKLTTISVLDGLVNLQQLNIEANNISDISVIRNYKQLYLLNIRKTVVEDISPIGVLNNLEDLNIAYTKIPDLSPIYNLKTLKRLDARRCNLYEISWVEHLDHLEYAHFWGNQIRDPRPLLKLEYLQECYVGWNPPMPKNVFEDFNQKFQHLKAKRMK